MTSNMIYIVAFDVGLKCPRKIHLNKPWVGVGVRNFCFYSVLMVPNCAYVSYEWYLVCKVGSTDGGSRG